MTYVPLNLRHKHFELGSKPMKLLARQLKSVHASRSMYSIRSDTGTLLTDPVDINRRFREFYSELYSSKHNVTHSDLSHFFDSLPLSRLSDTARTDLDSNFTLQEVITAIKLFPLGKAPGPDRFGCKCYKRFCDIPTPLLFCMVSNSKNENVLLCMKLTYPLFLKGQRKPIPLASGFQLHFKTLIEW